MKNLEPGQWVAIDGVNAVVCRVWKDNENLMRMEYVFMCNGRPANKCAVWHEDRWLPDKDFGGCAEGRLAEYITILKAGRRYC